MRIGIVCYPTLGGSGVLATELGHELALKGHQVHFITFEPPFRLRVHETNLFYHEVEMNHYDLIRYPDYALSLAVKIASVSKEQQLDILHVHYAIPHATSAYLARQLLGEHCPAIITTLHGTDITVVGRDPAYYEIVKFSIEQSDGVTAVSDYLKRKTQEYFQISKPIELIYNFFTPQAGVGFDPALKKQFTPNGEKLIVHASNFRPVKRVLDVVQIFARVHKRLPAKLLFVGTGVDIDQVRHLVAELKLEQDVIYLGKQTAVDRFIACADLFLLPSSQESFGLAALEAMAYAVPVVATSVGGIPEVVTHGETGFLAPVGDVDLMAESACLILEDAELAKRMGQAGKQRAEQHFTVKQILPQYLSYYDQFLVP